MSRPARSPQAGGGRRVAAAAFSFTALCIASGCGGSLFQSKTAPPTVYRLSAAAGAPGAPIAADLAVLRPRVRPGLNTDRIAASYPDRRLDYYAGARWGGPLDEVAQDLAVEAFHARANLRNVSSDASAFIDGYWLELDVEDFQAEYGADGGPPTVVVRLRGRVGGAADRRLLGQFVASGRQRASANRLAAIVEAYELAADAAFSEIVAETSAALAQR
jgi:cholesterol transport system auxiliary component